MKRGLAVVRKAARNYPKHRKCFSCHHQALPLVAMVAASLFDSKDDKKLTADAAEIVKFTRKSFRGRIDRLKAGKGIGGRAMTVAYGLWTLEIANEEPDDPTEAMVTYLLKTQHANGYWVLSSHRPPLEESRITCTTLALSSMKQFATKSQQKQVDRATEKAEKWLLQVKPKSTEDYASFLISYNGSLEALETKKERLTAELMGRQQPDGGWGQKPGMKSDAYATGQVVVALFCSTNEDKYRQPIRNAVRFLLKTQKPDGSWFVKTRSRPVQVFFDNGDPHGKSQFISIPATAWATTALAAFAAE
ncbi:MAG: prenyltransferase/squalene oxidase repeat-containing protein [Planctomycetaceae bacterium]